MKIVVAECGKGYASYTYKLANQLSDLGNTVIYISSKTNPYIKYLNTSVISENVLFEPNVTIKNRGVYWFINRLSVFYRNIIIRNRIIRKVKPDIVNIHSTIPLIDQFLFRNTSAKYIMTVHNVIPHKKSIVDKGYCRFLKKQDALIVHTKENKDELNQFYGITKNVYVIPHGVDVDYDEMSQEECKKRLGVTTTKRVLLFFGAIKEYKGLDILLTAIKDLDVFVLIAGHVDGSFRKYEELIEKNSIEAKCIIDFVPENLVSTVFQAADFVVLPYIEFHSQSGVLMQIAKYRKPVIATDVGGFKTFIGKYNMGIICKPNSADDLKSAIEAMINIESQITEYRIGSEMAVNDNSWETVSQKYNDVFCELKESME